MARALFGRFLSPPARSLRIHWPLSSRSTLHAPRHPPLGPAGSGHAQTLPRWLLPATDRRITNRPNGTRSRRAALYFSMSPNQAISAENSISSPPTRPAQPLTILSRPEAPDSSGFRRDCRSALGRNARPFSLLGQDDSCVLVGMADAPFPRNPRPRSPDADRQPPYQG